LDGTGDSILKVDLTTFAVVSQVVVPSTTGPFAIQPTPTGPGNEAWVANGGTEISVVDLGTQSLLSTILTPSIPQGTEPVAGIVFTNSGATALEAVGFYTPDSSGNNGALLVIDAASQQVTSTLPLKTAPTALVMAPDGLTAYILDGGGTLTYYDVLSGTADLSVSTYLPGMSGGYPGAGSQVFIHPDGTRLFWNENYILSVFDLTTRQITNFNSGLPSTSPVSFQLSQDGSIAFMGNGAGNVVFLDTRYGTVINTYQGVAWGTAVFGFNPVN
jgi:hypothetical protein